MLIVYSDTLFCSSCYINNLYLWDEFLELERKNSNFSIQFIMEVSQSKIQNIIETLNHSLFKHTVLLDTARCFYNNNKHIPKEPLFHTFLLDENNNVILVGSPLQTKKMKELLYKTLEERSEAKLPSSTTN